MKFIFVNTFIFSNLLYYMKCICIQGMNCPKSKGKCVNGICECINNYFTLIDNNSQINSNNRFCEYAKINRIYPLILELFFPSFGHFFVGKYYIGFIKLALLIIPIICFAYGYYTYKTTNEENTSNYINSEENLLSARDNAELEPTEAESELHVANKVKQEVSYKIYFPIVVTFLCSLVFFPLHIMDFIFYFFGYYYDGNGVPLI